MEDDVVDLSQEVACGRLVADGGVHLGQLQAHAHGEVGDGEGVGRSGPHGPPELPVRFVGVASVHGEAGGRHEGWCAQGVVVQPGFIDGVEGKPQMFGGFGPSAAIHRQPGQFRPADHDRADVAEGGGDRAGFLEEGGRPLRVAEEELRLGEQAQRHGVPGAPRRFRGRRIGGVGGHLPWPGRTHERAQHGLRGVE